MSKILVYVTYVGGLNTNTIIYNEKNYKDIDNIEASLESVLQTDDYGIDDVWVDGIKSDISWKDILTDGSRINKEILDKVFEEDEDFLIKLSFLNEQGFDIDDIDDVIVYDASKDDWKENFSSEYPEGLLDEWSKTFYPNLLKELQKANADSYFDWARVFSDNEVNGDFTSSRIDDYFVYMYR